MPTFRVLSHEISRQKTYIPASHIILTPNRHDFQLSFLNAERQTQLVPILKAFGMTRPGVEAAISWTQVDVLPNETHCRFG